jgi:predicted negative regulator of RcsB-dependent stress response
MKKGKVICLGIILLSLLANGLYSSDDQNTLNKAKQYLFDKEWDKALNLLDQIVSEYPGSKYIGLVRFYRAKCYKEQGKLKDAYEEYKYYLGRSGNMILKEEANVALIDISLQLFKLEKDNDYIDQVLAFLKNRNKTLQYYAAVQLSYLKNKKISRMAIPVLVRIVKYETDEKLKDLAKIALMRIDPGELKKVSPEGISNAAILKIHVFSKEKKKIVISLVLPYGFAKFALEALPNYILESIAGEGYSISGILDSIVKGKKIFQMEDEEHKIKIWIE